ncbi:MAG: tRNA (adenosine(37)-N6)-threonylcarbamoyltransferase complex ATPase subunit type 1 TsaE [Clostridia bacterium]|nr:tRNA (adenosine(37)-N6)-threonylcarbamoyltransferase complex ATPase subunit type 1 TsaE [Clostridia bacterium]
MSHSTDDTEAIGGRIAKALDGASVSRAVIAMRGEMGVGKTAFTRGFLSALGGAGAKSPTYTVVNEYRAKRRVFHFDMYRIDGEDDLLSIGYDDYLDTDGYAIIEWSENITEFLPEKRITVTIDRCDENESDRKITVEIDGFAELTDDNACI